jgi:ketosteroid isomerase-like protein
VDEEAIVEGVLAALDDGASPDVVWDALLVAGADQLLSGSFGNGRHQVTSSAAHRVTSSVLHEDGERLVHVLQAACAHAGAPAGDPALALDAIEPVDVTGVDEVVEALPFGIDRDRAPVDAARRALAFLENGGAVAELLEAWRQRVVVYTDIDFHEYKMLHTVMRESARMTSSWRNRFVAATFTHAPSPHRPEWPGHADLRAL